MFDVGTSYTVLILEEVALGQGKVVCEVPPGNTVLGIDSTAYTARFHIENRVCRLRILLL